MADRTHYVCQSCGYEALKWMGRCPSCGQWNTLQEEVIEKKAPERVKKSIKEPQLIGVVGKAKEGERFSTGFGELDRVTGGGIVQGSLILIGGDPGIGKSTLMLQVCKNISGDKKVLYISGEESVQQVRMRGERLGISDEKIYLAAETDIYAILEIVKALRPDVLIIDSIQTVYDPDLSSSPGSVSQVRQITSHLMRLAKGMNVTTIIVGHVTKDGSIAGPRVLEHMVDTVLYFEGENRLMYRMIRAVKNRFGSTNEVGIFEMTGSGIVEVKNPSEMLLRGRPLGVSGSCITCSVEGTRPILAELQALVAQTTFGIPRRMCTGIDFNRMLMIIAVLEKRFGMMLGNQDIYFNVAGGIKLTEPACDLAVALAIASGYRDVCLSEGLVAVGEIGLAGEIRPVTQPAKRVIEASRMGFDAVIMPHENLRGLEQPEGIKIYPVKDLQQALSIAIRSM
ncbi:DNA repair protein RadA [Caldanaerobius polysaccharolyticus]|uniref:DNA repair protein RadA n=1 Tax=Caldanaerobius polysaccharolyticus TaxID=44256 RepID=UPI00047DA962|nr:DNA repair protein RadA [Caldanaerobius polysaccharolyticus]